MAGNDPQAPSADTRREVIKLLRGLDRDAPPSFRGRPLDRSGVVALARASADGDSESQTILDELYELRIIGDLSEDPALAAVDEEWRLNMELLPLLLDEMRALAAPLQAEDAARAMRGRVLLALLDPGVRRDFAARATTEHPVLEANDALRHTLGKLCREGSEPIRQIAAALAYEPARERYERESQEREAAERAAEERRRAAETAEAKRREEQTRAAAEERMRPVRRRDRAIALGAILLVATVWPAAALGDVLSRVSPLRDGGAVLLRRLGVAMPVVNLAYWSTGTIAILAVAAVTLCIRRQIRRHWVAMAAIPAFAVAAGVLALMLPGMRNDAWAKALSRLATPSQRGPCTHWESAAYTLKGGIRQPIIVGPAPCQAVARVAHERGRVIWRRWISEVHLSRIHKFDSTLVVGGTYGGTRTRNGVLRDGRLVAVGVGPLTGRELWRRTCHAPADGEHALAFGTTRIHGRTVGYIRLRCATGKSIRVTASGRFIK